MRRHILLWCLFVAIILAIALLRSARRPPEQIFKAAATVTSPSDPPFPADFEPRRADGETADAPASAESPGPVTQPEGVKQTDKQVPKTRHVEVIVSGGDGPVDGAKVLLMRSRDYQESYQGTELRTNKEGRVEFDVLMEREWVFIYASAPGKGYDYTHFYGRFLPEGPVRMNLMPGATLRVACKGKDGAPLKDVNLAVVAEIELSSSYDLYGNYVGSKYVRLPTQEALTNEEGRCAFEFLNRGRMRDKVNGPSVQAWKFSITAVRPGGAIEQKIDGIPEKEIVFVLE